MQPIIYIKTEDKNEILYTTRIIQNELGEYQVLSSNYFNLGIKEDTELKKFSASIKNNTINFGFIPKSISKYEIFCNKHEHDVLNLVEFNIDNAKIVDNRLLINSDKDQISFSIHINEHGNKSLYGPVIALRKEILLE